MIKFIIKYRTILIHISAWLLVFMINILDPENLTIRYSVIESQYPSWAANLLLFYINYLIFVPKLLLRKRYIIYFATVAASLLISLTILRTAIDYQRLQVIDKAIVLLERHEPLGELVETKILGERPSIDKLGRRRSELFSRRNYNLFYPHNQMLFYSLLLVTMISLIIRCAEEWKENEEKHIRREKEHISSELQYLKQQINPHFLFNAINSIYSLTLPYSDAASNSILKLSSILRYMLYNTRHSEVFLNDELEIIKDYIGLQELRLTENTRLSVKLPNDVGGVKIEPLLLIPILENSFKYGINPAKSSSIEIDVEFKNNILIFKNSNDIVREYNGSDSGIGLKNIKRRLELIYPDNHSIKHYEKDGVYTVILIINFNEITI